MTLKLGNDDVKFTHKTSGCQYELAPDGIVFIERKEFGPGDCVCLSDADGKTVVTIKLNPASNRVDKNGENIESYTLMDASGYDFLIPVPSRFSTLDWKNSCYGVHQGVSPDYVFGVATLFAHDFILSVDKSGVEISNSDNFNFISVSKVFPEPSNDHVIENSEYREIPGRWQPITLMPGDYVRFVDKRGVYCGTLFAMNDFPSKYIFKSADGKVIDMIEGKCNKQYVAGENSNIDIAVSQGRIYLSSNGSVLYSMYTIKNSLWTPVQGGDGGLVGIINGGRKVVASTRKVLGDLKIGPDAKSNDDSVGIDFRKNRLLIADGLGGGIFGDGAALQAITRVGRATKKDLMECLNDAHNALWVYNYCLLTDKKADALSSSFGGKVSDTILGVADLRGDECEFLALGDIRGMQVRNGKIISISIIASLAGYAYTSGHITVERFMNHNFKNVIATSMYSRFDPHRTVFDLESGDKIVLWDDGVAMSEFELARIVSENDPIRTVAIVNAETAARNMQEEYETYDENGRVFKARTPKDNASVIVYEH
jgi:serine/threonine protein phosphatase PrpC